MLPFFCQSAQSTPHTGGLPRTFLQEFEFYGGTKNKALYARAK